MELDLETAMDMIADRVWDMPERFVVRVSRLDLAPVASVSAASE